MNNHEVECPSIFRDNSMPCICTEVLAAKERGYQEALQDLRIMINRMGSIFVEVERGLASVQ